MQTQKQMEVGSSKFAVALEKQLDLFKTANEWSDFVAHLTGLETTLRMYNFSAIPCVYGLYRRLNQCLNPALPSGVHTKALDVYKIVLAKLAREALSRDIEYITLGLFSFYRHANLSTIPNYLSLILGIVDILGEDAAALTRKIVMAVILGLEEENGEFFGATLEIFQRLGEKVGKARVTEAVWECMVHCPHLISGATVYLTRMGEEAEIEDRELMGKAFSIALGAKEIVILRRVFDTLIQYPREGFFGKEETNVVFSVLKLLLTKEMSLAKRVQQWICAVTECGASCMVETLKRMSSESAADRVTYFKILSAMEMDVVRCNEVFRRCIVWGIQVSDGDAQVKKQARRFFANLDRRLLWGAFKEAVAGDPETEVGAEELRRSLEVLRHGVEEFDLLDETASSVDLPEILGSAILLLNRLLSSQPDLDAVNGCLRLCTALFEDIRPSPASLAALFDSIKAIALNVDLLPISALVMVREFLGIESAKAGPIEDRAFWESFFTNLLDHCSLSTLGMASLSIGGDVLLFLKRMRSTRHSGEEAAKAKGPCGEIAEYVPVKRIFTALWNAEHPEAGRLLWKYDTILNGALQREIIGLLLYPRSSKDSVADRREITEITVDKCCSAVETVWNEELDDSKCTRLILHLISLASSDVHEVKSRALLFISRMKGFGALFYALFSLMNDQGMRHYGDSVVGCDGDLDEVIGASKILNILLDNSHGFVAFLKDPGLVASSLGSKQVAAAIEVIDAILDADSSDRKIDGTPASNGLRMRNIMSSGTNILLSVLYFDAHCLAMRGLGRSIPDLGEGSKMSELRSECFTAIKKLVDRSVIDSAVFAHLRKSLLVEALENAEENPPGFYPLLQIIQLVGAKDFQEKLVAIFRRSPAVREELLRFALENKDSRLAIACFEISCKAIALGEWSALSLVGHILHHYVEGNLGSSGHVHASIPCTCNPEEVSLGRSECSEEHLMTFIDRLLWTYTSLLPPQSKGAGDAIEDIAAAHLDKCSVIKKMCMGLYARNPQVFCEVMIFRFEDEKRISFIGTIDKEMVHDVFNTTLRLTSTLPIKKYTFLSKWLEHAGPSEGVFESEETISTLSAILSQTRARTDDLSPFKFFASFFKIARKRQSVSIAIKTLDLCLLAAQKAGARRISEVHEDKEKLVFVGTIVPLVKEYVEVLTAREVPFERFSPQMQCIWATLILPSLKSPSSPSFLCSVLLLADALCRVPGATRLWKKDFYECFVSSKFFRDTESNLEIKMNVMKNIADAEILGDLMSRAGGGSFFTRDSDNLGRAAVLKRLRFILLASQPGEFVQELPSILGHLSEIFNIFGGSRALLIEAYGIAKALCCRIPGEMLGNLWPIAIGDALGVIREEKATDPQCAFAALRFLDVVATLDSVETLEFRWLVEGLCVEAGICEEAANEPLQLGELRAPFLRYTSVSEKEEVARFRKELGRHHLRQKHLKGVNHALLEQYLADDFMEL